MWGYLVLILLLNSQAINHALECVVCSSAPSTGDNSEEVVLSETDHEKPIYCDQLSATNETLAIRKCPPESVGCHTQISGHVTVKTCSRIPANDCKTANGITYCYCTGTRCNSQINSTGNELSWGPTTYSTHSAAPVEPELADPPTSYTTPLTTVTGSSKTVQKNKSTNKPVKLTTTKSANPTEAAVVASQQLSPTSMLNISAETTLVPVPLLSFLVFVAIITQTSFLV